MPRGKQAISGFTAGRSLTLPALALAAPVQSALTTSTAGGTGLTAATAYFYVVTALNAAGQTVKSNEQTVTTGAGATNSVVVSWAAVSGATGYRIYRGTATGAQSVFYSVGAVVTFTDTGAASTAGTPPLVNTTGGTATAFAKGATVPSALVGGLRRASALLSKRVLVPSSAQYPSKLNSGGRLAEPSPITLNAKERRGLGA